MKIVYRNVQNVWGYFRVILFICICLGKWAIDLWLLYTYPRLYTNMDEATDDNVDPPG